MAGYISQHVLVTLRLPDVFSITAYVFDFIVVVIVVIKLYRDQH